MSRRGSRGVGWLAAIALACAEAGSPDTVVGTLERDRIALIAESREPIVEQPVAEGEAVKAGQLVVRLDDRRLAAQLAQLESRRERAAARLAELVRGPRAERIAEARARLAGAESALVTAERDLERAEDLREGGVVSPDLLDQRRSGRDRALAERDAARASLAAYLHGTTDEELQQARAALGEAEGALADLRVRAERLSVRAPRDGVVDALPFQVGERPPNGAVVAVLLIAEAPYARVYVPEPVRVRVGPGTRARLRVDGVAEPFEARVRTVSREASFTPYFALTERDRGRLSYVAKVDLTEPRARELPTGLPVEVEFLPAAEVSRAEAQP